MVELPESCRLPSQLLAIALFIALHSPDLLGQSLQASTAPSIDVLSAHFNRVTGMIQFKLMNNSQKAATAYYVAFGVRGENDHTLVHWESGTGEDLLDNVLMSQCRNASANALRGDDSWEGEIKLGDVYLHLGGSVARDQ